MRTGVSITITPSDRHRLEAVAKDRNAAQKHAWRALIVLLSADGIGTNEIMRRTGKSKTCVWRWQERVGSCAIRPGPPGSSRSDPRWRSAWWL